MQPASTAPTIHYGANPGEWEFFAYTANLKNDLLPVVSNPSAIISPDSRMKDLGKTPSRYDDKGRVVGIGKWTQHAASASEIERWSKVPDYGMCIQTRNVRAIDVDVTDAPLASTIRDEVLNFFGARQPAIRKRSNSPKFLIPFRLPGDYSKRILQTAHGNIEFLATGQQFIASGTHPSGVRYEWTAQPNFPELTPNEFEDLWRWLEAIYGVEKSKTVRRSDGPRVERQSDDADDPMVDWLYAKWEVRGESRDGRIDIKCPFEEEHTTDSGPTSTSYYPAGVGGYQRGHFVCLHAHCAGRDDGDFVARIGNPVVNQFPDYSELDRGAALIADLIAPPPAAANDAAAPTAARTGDHSAALATPSKRGAIPATLANVAAAMQAPERFSGCEIRHDRFLDEIMISPVGRNEWRPYRDADGVELRLRLEQGGFRPIGRELIRDVVLHVAERNQFDSAQIWLASLPVWDGQDRIANFLPRVFGCINSNYHTAIGLYVWTAIAGRIIKPGVKADMAVILYGPQGIGKSTAIARIVPDASLYREIDLSARDADLARTLRGVIVAEISELRGLHSREQEHIKATLSRTHESWVPKYREHATTYARRVILFGTTNKREFLADETGERRFLPVDVPGIEGYGVGGKRGCDLEWLESNRAQLFAEGAHLFRAHGVMHRDAERLAKAEHGAFKLCDAWQSTLANWLSAETLERFAADSEAPPADATPRGRAYLRAEEVAQRALGIQPRDITKAVYMRIGAAMHELGFTKAQKRNRNFAKSREWVYVPAPVEEDGDQSTKGNAQ